MKSFGLEKKSQLSIFIIIAVSIIVLFVFLFSMNSSQTNQNVNQIGSQTLSNTNQKLFPLKSNVDFCLQKQLRRALIISGMKGGFIYNQGEYYSNSVILPNTYKKALIENLNLNWNNLINNVLVESQASVYVPQINSNGTIYNHTITQDYNKFILNEFLKCIDLSKYKDAGYKVINENFIGNIDHILNSKNAVLQGTIGNVGDNISIDFLGKTYLGNISSINLSNKNSIVTFKSPVFKKSSNQDFSNIKVRDLSSKTSVNVSFSDESVTASLDFPILIKKGNFTTSYQHSQTTENIRFKKYLDLAQLLLNAKQNNRSLDYSKKADLYKILNSSQYFRNTHLKNFKVIKTVLNNSQSHKQYVYTIEDFDDTIYGNPYIFNFGYENDAPRINLSKLGSSYYSKNKVLIITSVDTPIKFNLKHLVTDKQFFDNYKFHFIPQHSQSSTYTFNLDSQGNLSFKALIKQTFTFNIQVSDGEAIRTQRFVFISGFPQNKNNADAMQCLNLYNYHNGAFPMNSKYENRVYQFKDSYGQFHPYGYIIDGAQNGISLNPINQSYVQIARSCLGTGGQLFDLKASYKDLTTGTTSPMMIKNDTVVISNSITHPLQISIGIYSKTSGKLVNLEPFKIEIYPAQCLGPSGFNSSIQKDMGGIGTCCDLSQVSTKRTSAPSNLIKNLYSNNKVALNTGAYFTFDIFDNGIFPTSFNFEKNIIWKSLGSDATSIFEGTITAKCQGVYPKYENNIDSISSSNPTYSSQIKSFFTQNKIYSKGTDFTNTIPISLKVAQTASTCEFSNLSSYEPIKILTKDERVLRMGFKNLNPSNLKSLITTIPTSSIYNDAYVLCDNNYYGSIATNPTKSSDWVKDGNLGTGGNPSWNHISEGYCYQGSSACAGRVGSPTYDYRVDNVNLCEDYSISNGQNFIKKVSNSKNWVCDSYLVDSCSCSGISSGNHAIYIQTQTNTTCQNAVTYQCPARQTSSAQSQSDCNKIICK